MTRNHPAKRPSSEFQSFVGEFMQFAKLDNDFANAEDSDWDLRVRRSCRKIAVRAGGHGAPAGGHVLELLETCSVKYPAVPTSIARNEAGRLALGAVNVLRAGAGGTVRARWWLFFVPAADDAWGWHFVGAQSQAEGQDMAISTSVDWVARVLALREDCGAVYEVAWRYRKGKGVKQDPQAAFRLLKGGASITKNSSLLDDRFPKMFRDGSAVLCNLGDHYEHGLGVARDLAQALYWYERSAEKHNCVAEFSLGTLYANGHGVKRDVDKAIEWFERASAHGSADARVALMG